MIHNKARLGEPFVSAAARSADKPRNWGAAVSANFGARVWDGEGRGLGVMGA